MSLSKRNVAVGGGGGGGQEGKESERKWGEDGGCTWASVGLAAPESISSKRGRILGIEILPGGK